jgi:hypothetical protein
MGQVLHVWVRLWKSEPSPRLAFGHCRHFGKTATGRYIIIGNPYNRPTGSRRHVRSVGLSLEMCCPAPGSSASSRWLGFR